MNPTRRTERVASLIRDVLATEIQSRLGDPRIPPITSITRVEVSPDLSVAQVYVSVYAPDAKRKLALTALQSSAGRLRRVLGGELRTRTLPNLVFKLDDSLRKSFETVQIIEQAMQELGDAPAEGAAPPADAPPERDEPAGEAREEN